MATPCTIPSYLLDKENIRDTILRMVSLPHRSASYRLASQEVCLFTNLLSRQMIAYDEHDSMTLVNSVYTPQVTINYDASLLGSGAEDMPSTEWAKRLEHLHDRFDTTQHIVQ
ncbi:SnoaL-like domain-containing protein [Apiospora kogelbergensis]|uniref:SnoaL-like domain-containing protein n=1 Tax=Apiospora kogelbergensis TaxID=1337665 RepID=A0AAW0QP13_9PEZI